MALRNIFCRIGTKTRIAKQIISLFPDHDIYIEPFIGSGAVYFKKQPSKKEVINDKDKALISAYRLIKKVNSKDVEKYKNLNTLDKIQNFVDSSFNSPIDKLVKYILISCNTFGSTGKGKIYKASNPFNKLKNLDKYKERMKNTVILNQDYKSIIRKYDKSSALFYLDPPYEGSVKQDVYDDAKFDYNELANVLKKIKGKFILSINDSSNIRNLFNSFNIRSLSVKGGANKNSSLGKDRRELLIMNF